MKFKIPGLKKIDVLLLRSYVGPFAVTFFLSMFLFLMQFLWKFIDELVGKGIAPDLLAKLIGRKDKNKVKYMVKPKVLLPLTINLSKRKVYSGGSRLHFPNRMLPILLEIIHQQK